MAAGERLLVDADVLDCFGLAAGQSASNRAFLDTVHLVPAQAELIADSFLASDLQPFDPPDFQHWENCAQIDASSRAPALLFAWFLGTPEPLSAYDASTDPPTELQGNVFIGTGGVGVLPGGTLASVPVAITGIELRRLAGLFVPAALFVALIQIVGMYVASAGYVLAVLALPRHQSLLRSLAMALATPLALYVVFERMFQVTLPHGALAAAFGL